jgi:putative FmdB family regulatory protein
MPIYAFECSDCGHSFDRLQKLADADPTDCPACTRASLRRQLTAPSFRLAGSGWYETDFKKDGDKKRNLAESSGGGEAKVEGKTEAKVETKSEPAAAKPEASAPASGKPAAGAAD